MSLTGPTSNRELTKLGIGVSTELVEDDAELLPPGDSAMLQLRAAMRGILVGASSDIPELTAALSQVLTLVGDTRGRGLLGSFARERWELGHKITLHEIFVSGSHLSDDVDDIANTLIHELAHLLANVRGVRDTSNRGRYHSKRFKECAEELGLIVDYQQPHGFYTKGLAPSLRQKLARELVDLKAALVLRIPDTASATRLIATETPEGTDVKKKYASAACGCPKVLRMAIGYWEPNTVLCEVCGQCFVDLESQPSWVDGSAGGRRVQQLAAAARSMVPPSFVTPSHSIATKRKEIK